MRNKEKILGILLILSLGFNGFFAYKFINLEKTVAKMSMEELITNVDKAQKMVPLFQINLLKLMTKTFLPVKTLMRS